MSSADLALDDDARDSTDEAPPWAAESTSPAVQPTRMPTGTLAPPLGGDLESLRSLARRHRLAEAWGELAQTLRDTIDLGQLQDSIDEQETIDLYTQLGEVEGDVRGNVDEAIAAWREVIRIDPSDLRALSALEDLYVREGRWQDAVDVVEKRAMFLDDDQQRRETLLQAASIWEQQLAELTRAADIYARLWRADPTDEVAAARLEAIYRHQGQWTELVDVLLERSESGSEVEAQIETLHDVAEIYEHELDDPESAFFVLQAAFNRDGANLRTIRELERLATSTGQWQELLGEYTTRATALEREDRGAAVALWMTIGRGYREQLARVEDALHAVQQALRLDPHHSGALTTIAELQRARGHWNELGETLQRQAELETSPDKKAALYLQLGEAIEVQAQDLGGAIRAYEEVLVHAPESLDALDALVRLYRDTQAWEPLVEMLARHAEQATGEADLVRSWLEIATISDERLADAGKSIAAYRKVLELEPTNLAALRALEDLYDKSSQHEHYLVVLEAQLAASPSDADRVAIYERLALAWEERVGNLDRAADAYEQLLAIDRRNHPAYHLLARLYKQANKPDALVETYRNHIAAMPDVETQLELYVAMGQVFETELHDVHRAIETYNEALVLDGGEARALDGLGRLYEGAGAWDHAVNVLARIVELADDALKAELYWRIGRIQSTELGDVDGAEASFLRGLAIAPGYMPAMEALTTQYAQHGAWQKAAQMMLRAESHSALVIDKVRLLCAAANIYMHQLHDEQQAKQMYAAVIALDPEHADAGGPLADLYFSAGEWAELSPVIEMLCRKVGQQDVDPKHRGELLYRAARCADELGDFQKALGHYKSAYDLDPTHLPTLIGRADLLFKNQDWDGAGKLYQTILLDHRERQDDASVVRIYCRMGAIRQALGDRKKALAMFGKALELDPRHRDGLQAVIELQTQQGDWEAVVRAKRSLIEIAEDREKPQLLADIATLYQGPLHNAQSAAAAYAEALEVAPENHQLLQKLLDLCIEAKQWKMALEVISRFVALETDPYHRGVYLHAAATLCRDELQSLDQAVEYYDRALDSFFAQPERLDDQLLPRALKSFEAIDKVLTTKRDWAAQERAYRDMINRLPKDDDPRFYKLQVSLIDGLAEIYRTRLKQYGEATAAFELAQQMDPDNKLRHDNADRAEILAELYVMAGADHADKAIEQHTRMLRGEPFKYEAYKALARIYKDTNQYDKYWCLCSALKFLRKADADELQFADQHKTRNFAKAKHVMSASSWAKLAHPDEDRSISAILGACSAGVAALKAFPHKDFGLKREDRRQLEGDQLMFSRLFLYLAQVLNVPVPEIYLVDDNKAVDIQLANAMEKKELCPSFVVRPHVLQGKTEREIAFLLTRRLAFMRPEYYLRMLLPTNTELKVVLLSAIVMLQPSFPVPPNMVAPLQQYLPEMRKRMPPHALEQLGSVIQHFIKATPDINLAKWGYAVDAAAHRAGFVTCGDLEVAARAVAVESVAVDGPSSKDKVKQLVLFSISEDYFAIRAQMELTIGG
jgi:tetratricopeptide (TPR) repeat protein